MDDIFIPIIAIILTLVGFIYAYYTIKEKYSSKGQSNPNRTTTSSYHNRIKQIEEQNVTQSKETKIEELLKDPFNSRIHKLHKAIYIYCNRLNNKFISFDEYFQICFYMLNLLESHGELKNKEERYKAAELLLYFNGHENSVSYARILTNAKKVTGNPYHQFFTTEAWSIYDIYKELLGEFAWKPNISSTKPLNIDTIGRNIFKNHTNK